MIRTGLLPYVLGAIAIAVLLLIAAIAVQTWRLGAAQNARDAAELATQVCKQDLQVESRNRETCDAKLAEQNIAVDAVATSCTRESNAAGDRAREVLRRPPITVRDGTGPEVMNQWLSELLSSSQ